MKFVTEIGKIGISRTMLEAVTRAYRQLFEASEGDARRYMKAVLEKMGMSDALEMYYTKEWPGKVYGLIRDYFVHRGGCDVYYVPGIARLIFGSTDDIEDPDMDLWSDVKDIVKFISLAHKGEFSRNLEHISTVQEGPRRGMQVKGPPLNFEELSDMFSREIEDASAAERQEFENAKRSPTGYEIIVLDDFDKAHEFLKYTPEDSPWCYLQNKATFEDYKSNGNKLYLALAPGFENLKPGDKGYGRSMIGFDMGPVDARGMSKMQVCNNRYNHAPDLENENDRSGDSKYTEIELAEILGIPIWKDCPGYSEEELIQSGHINRSILERMFPDFESLRRAVLYKQDAIVEELGVRIEWRQFASLQPFEFMNAHNDLIICYAIPNQETDELTYFDMYRRVSGDIYAITDIGKGSKLVDETGKILNDTWFHQIGKPDSSGFPVPVARKNADHTVEWNLLDSDGKILLDSWYRNLNGPYGRKYIVIKDDDGMARLCLAETGEPILDPMDTIRHNIIDQTHVFMMEKDSLFNYWVDGVFLLDEWTSSPMAYADLYRLMRKRNGLSI